MFDICQIETAKSANNILKNITDRTKLAIESKCIIDDTVSRPNFPLTRHSYEIQNVQLCGVQGQVSTLKLIDKGLYVHVNDFNISLETGVISFANNLSVWVRNLIMFKNTCYLNNVVYSTAANTATATDINTAFGHKVCSKYSSGSI